MIRLRGRLAHYSRQADVPLLGTVGYLSIFIGLIISVMITPINLLLLIAVGCTLAAVFCFPKACRRLTQPRLLIMIMLMAVPPVFVLGDIDRSFAGIPYSSSGLAAGVQIGLRVLVVLLAVNGLTATVDISSMAGLFEKAGFRGLGFSIGVALNLLPTLQQSFLNAWRSLQMRGGLRRKRWRALQLLAMTVITNALNRAEEIALAAEARAYSPERSRSLPITIGRLDWAAAILSISCLVVIILLT